MDKKELLDEELWQAAHLQLIREVIFPSVMLSD